MLGLGHSKVVAAAEVFLRTHVDVVVLLVVQHGIYVYHVGYTDGAGRKTGIFVGVVGIVDSEHAVVDAAQGKVVHRKLHRGVRLKKDALPKTVQIQTGYRRFLRGIVRLLGHNAGQRHHFVRTQSQLAGFRQPLIVPEIVVLLLHALQKCVHRNGPVHVVGLGDEKTVDGYSVETQLLTGGGVGEGLVKGQTVKLQLRGYSLGQRLHGTRRWHRHIQRLLLAVLQVAEHFFRTGAGLDGVAPFFHMRGVVVPRSQLLKTLKTVRLAYRVEHGVHLGDVVTLVDIHILGLLTRGEGGVEVVVGHTA